jgi:hypothetical protein
VQTHLYYAVSWAGWTPTLQYADYFPMLGAQEIIVGDWSAGGDLDEVILWNKFNGYWLLYSFSAFVPTYQTGDRWNPAFDIAAPGDYDTDGRIDDVFLFATDSGVWAVVSFHRNAQSTRLYQTWGPGWDVISVGEFMN